MKHLAKPRYEFDFLDNDAIELAVNLADTTKGKLSRGGTNTIEISLDYKNAMTYPRVYKEYKRIEKDPNIGSIECSDAKDCVLVVVAHEVAHHIHHRYADKLPKYLMEKGGNKPAGHGETWRTIYRYLRADLVNPAIERKRQKLAS